MKNDASQEQTEAILKVLDDAIQEGPWDKSNFLRIVGRNLKNIRDTFANQTQDALKKQADLIASVTQGAALRSEQEKIFVSLYSAEGMNLITWERILANLPRQMISRPIYAKEEDIKALMNTKLNKNNEAYVSVYIDPSNILACPADKTPTDKLGKPLLTLKDNAIRIDNMHEFVHQTGIYQFIQGRLVKK